MRKIKNKTLAPALIFGSIAIAGLIWAGTASAGFNHGNDQAASSLAEKLGVDKSKVQEALGQVKEERQQTGPRGENKTRLDKAVSDGIITKEQEDLLIQKQNEFRTQMEELRSQHREEMEKWLEDQKIDSSKLREYAKHYGRVSKDLESN